MKTPTACDGSYVESYLDLTGPLSLRDRHDGILAVCEQMAKRFTALKHFSRSGKKYSMSGSDSGGYRWLQFDPKEISAGCRQPKEDREVQDFHELFWNRTVGILPLHRFELSTLCLSFGFELCFGGNQDALVADCFYRGGPYDRLMRKGFTWSANPFLQMILDPKRKISCSVAIRTNTDFVNAVHGKETVGPLTVVFRIVRSLSEHPPEPLDVICRLLYERGRKMCYQYIVPEVLKPLQDRIITS